MQRRIARSDHPGHCQRNLRRRRCAPPRIAIYARTRVVRATCQEEFQSPEPDRRNRPDRSNQVSRARRISLLQGQRAGASSPRSRRQPDACRRCRLSLPQFKLLRPCSVEEAVVHLAEHKSNIRVLAGGTDLIPSMRQKLFEPEYVLDLRGIAAMRGIKPGAEGGVEIGALTSLRAIERSDYLRQHYPVLTEAA